MAMLSTKTKVAIKTLFFSGVQAAAEYRRSKLRRQREDLEDQIDALDIFIDNAKAWSHSFLSDWARANGARSAKDGEAYIN